MSDAYDIVLTTAKSGRLRLKGDKPTRADRKRKKEAEAEEERQRKKEADEAAALKEGHLSRLHSGQNEEEHHEEEEEGEEAPPKLPRLEEAKTDAERRFEEAQRRREEQEARKLGARSHRERVDEFNKQLDRLPTHFDIPKVGPG